MMNDDDRLRQLLRSALPPVATADPSRDLWPSIVQRSRAHPRWSLTDLSVAAVIAIVFMAFPKWFWFLAYHL
jgi:hypothetical protein